MYNFTETHPAASFALQLQRWCRYSNNTKSHLNENYLEIT